MHVVVIFINIGSYHAARLRAAYTVFQQAGWHLTAIQATDDTLEHPWGDLKREITFPLKTLIGKQEHSNSYASDAAAVLPACLNNLKPDVVVIPGWGFPISQAALSWCKRRHIPTIVMSETKWDDEPRHWWKEQLKFWLYVRQFDAALVGGEAHRQYLAKLGFRYDRIFFGYDAVDNDYFTQRAQAAQHNPDLARQRQSELPQKPYFLAATRLLPRKNISRLIDAFAEYRNRIGSEQAWDLVICGSGIEEAALRQKIHNLQLEKNIHLPGFVTYHQMGDWYGLAKAFIHPALQEQWGLVVNEACAAGLPILCSHTVGASELIHEGQNGFTFDPDRCQDITRALVAIHQLDPNTYQSFSQMSQQIVANYHPILFGKGLLTAIQTVLQDRNFR
jgi:1,2-diacylglycerol 3-alpha-glucosyltransferase